MQTLRTLTIVSALFIVGVLGLTTGCGSFVESREQAFINFTTMKKKILMIAMACIWMVAGLLIINYSIDGQYEGMVSTGPAISEKRSAPQPEQVRQWMIIVRQDTSNALPVQRSVRP